MDAIWLHFIAAVFALILGIINLASAKGTRKHRLIGWAWLIVMVLVTVPSFWIKEMNAGEFSWIHFLSLWTLFCMGFSLFAIKKGWVRIHAGFMIGTMMGAIIAGIFALMPGRFLSHLLGYV